MSNNHTFKYFNEEWNEERTTKNNPNSSGVAGGSSHADTGKEQKEVHQEK